MLEPTTLPSARPGTPSLSALIEIRSSGADVPKATMVRLTMSAGMPTRSERFTAPRTSASPASSRITRPSPAGKKFHQVPCSQLHGPLPMR